MTSEDEVIRRVGEANGWTVALSETTSQLANATETHTFARTDGMTPVIRFLLDQHSEAIRVSRKTWSVVLRDGTTTTFPKTGDWWQQVFTWMEQLIAPGRPEVAEPPASGAGPREGG
ncbi:MAG: hypothetical protein WCD86_02095 [Ktedonobacteraceae bacterium]